MTPAPVRVAALYQFARFDDLPTLRTRLLARCKALGIRGTLLLAPEGINGTVAGDDDAIDALMAELRTLPGCAGLEVKYSAAPSMPFDRLKVRLKREIVTMGQPDIDPVGDVGTYVAPAEWNALIENPDTVVIDTRNAYEVALGTFAGAVDPGTRSFTEFPDWFRANRERLFAGRANPQVAMFCTGGIRCEKATAFLRAEGVDAVHHLKGGILAYLEQVPEKDSRWAGECFVFDQRVTLGHGLAPGTRRLCPQCQQPLPEGMADMADCTGCAGD